MYISVFSVDLVTLIEKMRAESADSSTNADENGDGVRQRRKSHSSANGTLPTDQPNSVVPDYTPEQLASVKRLVAIVFVFKMFSS